MSAPHITGITDEELMVYAMREAQLILAQHIEGSPRDATVTTDTIDSVLADQNGLTATSTRTIIIEVATSSQRSRPRKHAISDAFSSCYTALHISVRGAHSRVRYEHGESKSIRTH
jgi:hypothetical protein